jgi:hypothetical protein
MQTPQWETGEGDERYGLGLSLTTSGERRLIGHSGGWGGMLTYSTADPSGKLAIAVLTNSDGPAAPLVHAGVKLIDFANASPRPDGRVDPKRFTGRFVNIHGIVDVALLGGRLYMLTPTSPDPVTTATPLELIDEQTLRFAGGSGYGGYGEPLPYTFKPDGTVQSMRWFASATMLPLEDWAIPARFERRF